mmetsp:Transcript_11359/g.24064  ORF Transcript_11359/g.24064 Transcript_11359/m.24064 type:complete len:206 (-) Transcript_11359:385-1002(-)|eukprot:CAMPEP_0201118608 /NCGR_PEP_ID=MMETSP0850-20130426/2803_1 /ASSEMBLY_ACC=CAM_ASM_000622 /TAXON_ID=183588 /ORGANISM="Pseudo-nitzschia fraudulenta, Strain WWA7" /LENGTH=205 /DNA_ID=CAMNT_0047383927 /DNA_START=100 /DNA_END=717 /DNA_ORIENTATION=-
MKLSSLLSVPAILSTSVSGFSVAPNQSTRSSCTTQLQAEIGRRDVFTAATSLTLSAGALLVPVEAAFAEYVPRVDDMKQIYFLGTSLDKLIVKLEDPTQIESALAGVKLFNKDPTFYSSYAKNFVMKSVKKGSDSDPRVGYIKQASTLIGSLESVLEGGDALMNEKSTTAEAVARVKKAQTLISKFIEECGVQDDKLAAFVASHK